MAIRLRQIARIDANPPPTEGYLAVNCVSWFENNVSKLPGQKDPIPLYQLSSYHLRDPVSGCLFQGIFQGSKLYKKVNKQNQPKNKGGWKHSEEVHVDEKGNILPAYWAWREKVYRHPNPVRYPNGYHGRNECLCSLWYEDGKLEVLDYFQARSRIYVALYAKWVKETQAFKQLKALVDAGVKLELLGLHCPDSIEFTRDNFNTYLYKKNPLFGFTWTLAACLTGML